MLKVFSSGETEASVHVVHCLRVLLHLVDGGELLDLGVVVQTPVLPAVQHLRAFPDNVTPNMVVLRQTGKTSHKVTSL